LADKVDTILANISKQNIDNVPLQDFVGNNAENIDVNYIRKFDNNGYGKNTVITLMVCHFMLIISTLVVIMFPMI
jgi:hypothetical protein